MIALSIQQPWAWAIIHGGKDIENRTWRTGFRGRLLIHAGLKFDADGETSLMVKLPMLPNRDALPRGGVVGMAEIVDCVTQSDREWFYGPVGFILRQAKPLPFFACRGHLGFFPIDVPDSLREHLP